MRWVVGLCGSALLAIVLWDAFETIVLPRRVTRRWRLTRLFYRSTWKPWRSCARLLPVKRREAFLGVYGPLSLIMLLGLWAMGSVFAFGMLQWAAGAPGFGTDVYFSGTTFFTLGLGDVVPHTTLARVLTTIESGTGFAFLAIVIGYLPVIYQAFSRREVAISLLDARAGSPPTAGELFWRYRTDHKGEALQDLLKEWERWAAEVLESHLSYPVLALFRSQHYGESWLGALTAILDVSALATVSFGESCARQAELTFAMARHTVVDLAQVFSTPPARMPDSRLSRDLLARLRSRLSEAGLTLRADEAATARLRELVAMYEPYVRALADYLAVPLPPWIRDVERPDNWRTSAWDRIPSGRAAQESTRPRDDEHF